MDRALQTLSEPSRAAAVLHPIRRRILEALDEPASATALARDLDLSRQKVNYHLRTLESEGLVELAEERRRGNCIERVMRRKARAYLLDPDLLGELGLESERIADRASAAYLLAVAARTVHEVSLLRAGADEAGKRLSTLSLDARVRFASASDRADFATELTEAVAGLVEKYHDAEAERGHAYRLVVGSHPVPEAAEERRQERAS